MVDLEVALEGSAVEPAPPHAPGAALARPALSSSTTLASCPTAPAPPIAVIRGMLKGIWELRCTYGHNNASAASTTEGMVTCIMILAPLRAWLLALRLHASTTEGMVTCIMITC